MTRDSGSDRPQRTVAELLAEYGGTAGDAPRRRRRRAEDDGDSAPQTIIERVLSDSGKLLPVRDEQPAPEPPRRGGGHRSGEHRPVAQPQQQPQPPQPQQAPPAQQSPPARPDRQGPAQPGAAPAGPAQQGPAPAQPGTPPPAGGSAGQPTAYAEPVRPPAKGTGRQQLPPTRKPSPQPQPRQQPADQFPPSRPGMPPVGPPTAAVRPVPQPGPPSRPGLNSVPRNPTLGARPPAGPQRSPAPPVDDTDATAVHPPLLDDFADAPAQPPTVLQVPVAPPGLPGRPGLLPPDAGVTEEFPSVPSEPSGPLRPAAPGRPGPGGAMNSAPMNSAPMNNSAPMHTGPDTGPTQLVPAVLPPGRRQPSPDEMESTQAHAGPYVDDSDPGFPPVGPDADPDVFPSRDEYDRDEYGRDEYDDQPAVSRVDFDDDESAPASAGREWVLMGAQVGAGAVAGAAVWLAFSWLWGLQPVVAVVAALLVIVGLVLGVRRWRRADDLQTTVLAILAGLVVTVSPAALLLLHK